MASFKNITYVDMMTTEKPINVCYKIALECEESIDIEQERALRVTICLVS